MGKRRNLAQDPPKEGNSYLRNETGNKYLLREIDKTGWAILIGSEEGIANTFQIKVSDFWDRFEEPPVNVDLSGVDMGY